jgi:hypothetical protein
MYRPVILSPALFVAGVCGYGDRRAAHTRLPAIAVAALADGIIGLAFTCAASAESRVDGQSLAQGVVNDVAPGPQSLAGQPAHGPAAPCASAEFIRVYAQRHGTTPAPESFAGKRP